MRKKEVERCSQCGFRTVWCICNSIKKTDNKTEVMLITHANDQRKPSNTGKIIASSLANCRLIRYGNKDEILDFEEIMQRNIAILYPNETSGTLSPELYEELGRPVITVLDGTWSQAARLASKFSKKNARFIKLPPGGHGRYFLRNSGSPDRLCSAEALIRTLKLLGEETAGLENALKLFIEKNLQIRGRLPAAKQNIAKNAGNG